MGNMAIINAKLLGKKGRHTIIIQDRVIGKINPPHIPSFASIIDANGALVLPGFVDAHFHLVGWGLQLVRPNLSTTSSIEDAIELTKEYLNTHPIAIAEQWDEKNWKGAYPTKSLLDKAFPSNPVIWRRICGHIAIANSKALDLIPKKYSRWINVEAGILLEHCALYLNEIIPPCEEELKEAISKADSKAFSLGITTVHTFTTPLYLKTLMKCKSKLSIRYYLPYTLIPHLKAIGLRGKVGDDNLKFMGIKVFMDGSIGARTASLFLNYKDVNKRGMLLMSKAKLFQIVKDAEEAEWQLAIHAIGTKAIHTALNTLGEVISPTNPLRHRIEHFELPYKKHIDHAKELNILLSMQPNFIGNWSKPGGLYEHALQEKLYRYNNPIGDIVKTGINIALGSDCMPAGPAYGISSVATSPFSHQKLSKEQAIQYYSQGGAFAGFDEHKIGTLKEGLMADIIVVKSEDDLTPILTIKSGEIVYNQEGSK